MKNIFRVLAVLSVLTYGLYQSYRSGLSAGYAHSQRHYENVIGERVAQGIAGYQRVQVIREKSEYRRGWESCQEQF